MKKLLIHCLATPAIGFSLIALMSLTAVGAALYSEAFLGLEPCILCVYQRFPFALAFFLSLFGLTMRKKPKAVAAIYSFTGITFFVNSCLAFYHTGVEQKWWISAFEGCAVHFEDEGEKSILENILSAPTASCADIPWQDPIIGLSMANYNVILCLGLFVFCIVSAVMYNLRRRNKV